MDIAALSTQLSQMKYSQDASVALMKKAMETSEVAAENVVELLESSEELIAHAGDPNLGKHIDIRI